MQARIAREQLRWQRREARWAIRTLKLDLRSVKPVDAIAAERLKTLIKIPEQPITVKPLKPVKKKPVKKIKSRLKKKRKVERVVKKPIAETLKLPAKNVRYRCIMCGIISRESGVCCRKEMEEFS